MSSPGALLAAKMRGDTTITNEDIAKSSLQFFQNMGAPVASVSVGGATASVVRASDFEAGDPVTWVPEHAKGNAGHPDCQRGIVTSTNARFVFVRFNGSTSQACEPQQLVF